MTGIIINILLGQKYEKKTPLYFANIACKIVDIVMIVYAVIDFNSNVEFSLKNKVK